MVCLVSQKVRVGGLIHSDVVLKFLACPLFFKLVYKKESKFVLENQVAVSKQIHQNVYIACCVCASLNIKNNLCGKLELWHEFFRLGALYLPIMFFDNFCLSGMGLCYELLRRSLI